MSDSSNNRNNDQQNDAFKNVVQFIIIFAAFSLFWPLGIFLLLVKLGVLKAPDKSADSASTRKKRAETFRKMAADRQSVPLESLASATGIAYESVQREVQQLINDGYFGTGAYINYVDKTLVLPKNVNVYSSGKDIHVIKDPDASRVRRADYSNNSRTFSPDVGKESRLRELEEIAVKNARKAEEQAASAAKAKGGKKRKNYYRGATALLAVLGSILALVGFVLAFDAVDTMSWMGLASAYVIDFIQGVFLILGGGVSFFARRSLKRRSARFNKYMAASAGRDSISFAELARGAGVSEKTVRRDMEAMEEKRLFNDTTAYVDVGAGLLVLDRSAMPRQEEPATDPVEDNEDRYQSIIREIRQLNDDIEDEEVSSRIDKIEELSASIFKAVKEKPEKLPQIKSLMSYYLPTTLKLLHAYADFEKSGAGGENVKSARAEIEGILDTLVEGFTRQLDKLYEADAMDISADIDVLETMMKKDGLSEDGSGFNMTAGGTM